MIRRQARSETSDADIVTRTKRDEEIVVPACVAEQMRLLGQRLELRNRGQALLSVTGTARGEGATYIATALAVTLAHDSAMTVCLVDCDWSQEAEPDAEIDDLPSLGSVIRDGGDIVAAAQPTELDRLHLVPAGSVGPHERAPLANSSELAGTIEELSDAFDIVILDAPPLAGEAYPTTIARLASQIVYVIRQGGVPMEQARAAMRDLGEDQVAGVVLNATKQRTPSWLVNPMVAN